MAKKMPKQSHFKLAAERAIMAAPVGNTASRDAQSGGPDQPDDRDLARAAKYFARAKSNATRRIYARAWAEFVAYCRWRRQRSLPATPAAVVGFLSFVADAGASPSSLRQKIAALSWVHRLKKLQEPSRHAEVVTLLEGIMRSKDSARSRRRKAAKVPLDRELLAKLVREIDAPYPVSLRDRALLLVDYFGLLRRSEVVSLRIEDVSFEPEQGCMYIELRRSKTDQAATGHALPYPELDESLAEICPVRALKAWLDALASKYAATQGYIFRRITRWGRLVEPDTPISDQVVNLLVKKLAVRMGIPARQISAHVALRAGMATQLDRDGVPLSVIKAAGRWKSDAVASGYIRRSDKDLLGALRGVRRS